jgi:hypothetical protein
MYDLQCNKRSVQVNRSPNGNNLLRLQIANDSPIPTNSCNLQGQRMGKGQIMDKKLYALNAKPMSREELRRSWYQTIELWKKALEEIVVLQEQLKDCQCKK